MVVDIYWLKVIPHCEPLYGATAAPKYEHVLAPQPVVVAGGGAGAGGMWKLTEKLRHGWLAVHEADGVAAVPLLGIRCAVP